MAKPTRPQTDSPSCAADDFTPITPSQFFKNKELMVNEINDASISTSQQSGPLPTAALDKSALFTLATEGSGVAGFGADANSVLSKKHHDFILSPFRSLLAGHETGEYNAEWKFYELWGDGILYLMFELLAHQMIPRSIAGAAWYQVSR